MSTMIERKNYAAQCLLARGLNKTTIIAILCNGYHESGGSFSPTQCQIGGSAFGIWQWDGNQRQAEIIRYARTHSEKDAIKWQCNFLVDNQPNQWIAHAGISWDTFLHNKTNRDWKWLTWAFCVSWERPGVPLMESRYAAYNKIMPIDWGNGGGGGGDNIGGDTKPVASVKKYPTMKQCMALFDKMHPHNNQPENPDNQKPNPGGGGGAVGGFDAKPCLDYYNAHHGHLYYSMPGRAGVYSGRSADCSSFVSYMLHLGYHDNNTILYTTETLHDRLKALGYHCVEEGTVRVAHHPFKTGDVIILGRRGSSSGAGGHTGICLESPKIYDCNYTSNGLKIYASGQAFLNWNYATNYWYHYTK